ncbi:MAG TPA: thioredoxin family protein [Armatimonadota bacterium]
MRIEILGMEFPRCKQLYSSAEAAVRALGVEAELVRVEDLGEIAKYRVLSTPAPVVDGKVRAAGRMLTPEQIKAYLSE